MPEDIYFKAKLNDILKQCLKKNGLGFSYFMSLKEQAEARSFLQGFSDVYFSFYGGLGNAERVMAGMAYEEGLLDKDFPLKVLKVVLTDKDARVCHRDVLGAVLGLGVDRNRIGDIMPFEGGAFLAASDEIADFLIESLESIGRFRVKEVASVCEAPEKNQEFEEIKTTIPSPRLDAIISSTLNISRKEAEGYLRSEKVNVDFSVKKDLDFKVREGSLLSIRGHGRYRIEKIGPETKKGRLRLVLLKYL